MYRKPGPDGFVLFCFCVCLFVCLFVFSWGCGCEGMGMGWGVGVWTQVIMTSQKSKTGECLFSIKYQCLEKIVSYKH